MSHEQVIMEGLHTCMQHMQSSKTLYRLDRLLDSRHEG